MAKRRKRGDGSIHLRKDGRWEGRIVVGYDEKGLPKTKNVLAKTKSECSAKLDALKASLRDSSGPKQEKPKGDMTFGAWLDCWYQRECKPQIRPKTQADYENRIYQHIIPELGAIPLAKLTAADLQQFYNRLKQGGRLLRVEQYGSGLSDRMVKSCHVTCRMSLDQAVAQGLILKNPALSCKAPTTHPERPVNPSSAYRRLKELLKQAGLPSLRFHDLRHTFATHALASGVDAKTLSGILGHTKASFTLDTYTHVTGDMHRSAAEIVGNVVTEWLGDDLTVWQNEGNGATAAST